MTSLIRGFFAASALQIDFRGQLIRFSLLLAMSGVVLLIYGTPMAASVGYEKALVMVYMVCKPICHQIPARTLALSGYLMPLCARCSGIVLGCGAGAILLSILCLRFQHPRRLALVLCGPMIVDGCAQVLAIYPSPASLRFTSGFLFGGSLVFILMPGVISSTIVRNKNVGEITHV
jgi:uncharacterized membrane protein